MSPLRKIKAKLGIYKKLNSENFEIDKFYQFALNYPQVIKDIEKIGFKVVYKKSFDGIKGLKDEIPILKPIFQIIYDSNNIILRVLALILSKILSPISSHSVLLVFRKIND